MRNSLTLTNVSWIDAEGLPRIGFWDAASALTRWHSRVMIGLIATANPRPPDKIGDFETFRLRKHYRALSSVSITLRSPINLSNKLIDPGWTPPIDRSRIGTSLAKIMPLGDDPKYYPGESSSISSIVAGNIHPSSTLTLPHKEDRVLVSMLVKFRAGAHTNKIGIEKANSPVHVPWVWCETALVMSNKELLLLGAGSQFPSHAWYVNGKRIAMTIQNPLNLSETEPAISTGRLSGQPRSDAMSDKSTGIVTSHEYSIPNGSVKVKEKIRDYLLF